MDCVRVEVGLKIMELMKDDNGALVFSINLYNVVRYGFYKENLLKEALTFLRKMEKFLLRVVDRSASILGFCENLSIGEARRFYD